MRNLENEGMALDTGDVVVALVQERPAAVGEHVRLGEDGDEGEYAVVASFDLAISDSRKLVILVDPGHHIGHFGKDNDDGPF